MLVSSNGLQKRFAFVRFMLAVATLGFFWASAAEARKVALVIGNSAYANTTSLANPANDARLVTDAARAAGFDVTTAADLGNASFQRTLRDFRLTADGADIAMIYFAGHGIEGQGKNWLIPVDAKLETDFDLPYEAINMERLLEALSGAKVRMVILDACRNNPFGNAWKSGVRAVPRGLNGSEYDDVLVIFAAAPGQTATDGDTGNSPFATSLARRIPQSGLPLQMLGGAVRDDVLAATGGKQRPFVSASITGTPVFLVGESHSTPSQVATAPAPVSNGATGGSDRSMLDALMWQGAVSSNTTAAFQAYLREFPTGVFSNAARESIARLTRVAGPVPESIALPVATPVAVSAQPTSAPAVTGPAAGGTVAATAQPVVSISSPGGELANVIPPHPTHSAVQAPGVGRTLPVLPSTPRFSNTGYPSCREAYQSIVGTLEKVDAINRCTQLLDQYSTATLSAFRRSMIEHQIRISKIYTDEVGGRPLYSVAMQEQFFEAMMREHADSNPDGRHFKEFREAEAKYKEDRAYLHDRYCFSTGCAGYTAPPFVPAPTKSAAQKN